jgi:mRNA-degrading endonuclease RelE of RelBE toxin-antitoxin system
MRTATPSWPTFAEVISINRNRRHQIKKLEGVPPGDGQYRPRSGRWRLRYDIWSQRQEVELNFCGLRREDTY